MLDGNQFEKSVFEEYPDLKLEEDKDASNPNSIVVKHIKHGDVFKFSERSTLNDNLNLLSIHTPGHISDHMSFLLKDE